MSTPDAESLYEKIHGKHSVKNLRNLFLEICPELADYSIDFIFGNIYSDNVLSLCERELINVAALVAEGAKLQLKNHILGAYNLGCSPKKIIATILHMIIFVGFPKVINSVLVAKEVFNENKIDF